MRRGTRSAGVGRSHPAQVSAECQEMAAPAGRDAAGRCPARNCAACGAWNRWNARRRCVTGGSTAGGRRTGSGDILRTLGRGEFCPRLRGRCSRACLDGGSRDPRRTQALAASDAQRGGGTRSRHVVRTRAAAAPLRRTRSGHRRGYGGAGGAGRGGWVPVGCRGRGRDAGSRKAGGRLR